MWPGGGDRRKTYISNSFYHLTAVVQLASHSAGKAAQWFSSRVRANTQQCQQPDTDISSVFVASKFKTHLTHASCEITSRILSLHPETQS